MEAVGKLHLVPAQSLAFLTEAGFSWYSVQGLKFKVWGLGDGSSGSGLRFGVEGFQGQGLRI